MVAARQSGGYLLTYVLAYPLTVLLACLLTYVLTYLLSKHERRRLVKARRVAQKEDRRVARLDTSSSLDQSIDSSSLVKTRQVSSLDQSIDSLIGSGGGLSASRANQSTSRANQSRDQSRDQSSGVDQPTSKRKQPGSGSEAEAPPHKRLPAKKLMRAPGGRKVNKAASVIRQERKKENRSDRRAGGAARQHAKKQAKIKKREQRLGGWGPDGSL